MYKRELQQTARKSLFLKLLHLPYGILIPILISTEVTNALAGKTKSVLTTAAGILAIVFCYTYFLRQAGNRVPKRKGTGGSGVQNEAVSDDFCQFL